MGLKNTKSNDKFVSILADGTLRLVVPEGTEGAVKREYESSDGKTGVKYELVYTELAGMITHIGFYEGDYGKLIQVTVTDEEGESYVLSVSTAQNYGEDLMKKLPNVDLKKPVKFVPYSFEDDNKKVRKGITIYQDEEKIQNFYYDADKKKNINGYPDPKFKKKTPTKDDWKLYFLSARMFLIDDITERLGITDEPRKESKKAPVKATKTTKKDVDESDEEDDY